MTAQHWTTGPTLPGPVLALAVTALAVIAAGVPLGVFHGRRARTLWHATVTTARAIRDRIRQDPTDRALRRLINQERP